MAASRRADGALLAAGSPAAQTALLALFTLTLFLSALLLFSVQPVFARMLLPRLGGAASVWAVSMVCFQALLLAGYGLAHLLDRLPRPGTAALAHAGLLAAAMLGLPFGLAADLRPPPGDAYWWLASVLVLEVGLPVLALAATAPLLQAWFARTGHAHAGDPYFLYGASNLGSLLGLLSYPLLVEPFFGLKEQSLLWSTLFLLLGALVAACAMLMLARGDASSERTAELERATPAKDAVKARRRLTWLALGFVPSGLLVAFTTALITDIASAPFLWVIPLSLFLLTFPLTFKERPVVPMGLLRIAQPVFVAFTLLGLAVPGNQGWIIALAAGLPAFLATTLVCHRRLYESRPSSRHLTGFYLWMSAGGVLGGAFASLLAPALFDAVYEYPLLLVLGMACAPGIAGAFKNKRGLAAAPRPPTWALLLLLLLAGNVWSGGIWSVVADRLVLLVLLGAMILLFLSRPRPLDQLGFAALMGLSLVLLPSALNAGFSERSFFGVHRVMMDESGDVRLLIHGTTMHGAERLRDKDGRPIDEPVPATYYHPESPLALAARRMREQVEAPLRVASVGLGAGAMACHSRAEEDWQFFEIDPVVVEIASNPRHFSFLSHCRPEARIVLGDGRLSLEEVAAASFDYLIIDAFSSDSVPVHLLTREAIELYLDRLRPDGLLALHLSNRHLDLASVAVATARSIPATHLLLVEHRPEKPGYDRQASRVLFVARSPEVLAPLLALPGALVPGDTGLEAWTDDYANLLAALWRHHAGAPPTSGAGPE